MLCADTSFLLSFYGADAHTGKARAWMGRQKQPLTLHPLNEVEIVNALHLATFRRVLSAADGDAILRAWQADIAACRLVLRNLSLADVTAEAVRIAHAHTRRHGCRAFDVLHVAAARLMGAKTFLSFDAAQLALARLEGLRVAP